MSTLLIKNAELITMNQQDDQFIGDIYIEHDTIKDIGKSLDYPEADKVIDATDRVVTPGFIQTHIHLCQTIFRGKGDDLELMDWLKKRIWPLEAAHDEESIYYSALLGTGELIQSGTTSIVDMETVHHTDYAFQAIEKSGIRALSGKVMMDKGDEVPKRLQENTTDAIQQSVDLMEKWHKKNGRIHYAFSPRFVVSCTETLLKEVATLSRKHDTYVHTHASENKGEIEIVEAETGMRNIEYLDYLGLANERLILAHCVWLNETEKRIIQQRKVNVSHCPGSNLKLASGVANIPSLLDAHICVSLGADGAPCNNNLDMFNEMRLAALIQKPAHGPTAMDAKTVFKMATIDGAKAMGLDHEIGSLEIGKKADLIILNLHDFHMYPSYDVDTISRIVYSTTRADVETTIIHGDVVMEERCMKTIDKDVTLKEANHSIKRLIQRLPHIS
ncbi:5'-deoxyadenosine deaminase [Salipaludibacillus agaradhaerens]|uniref:5'-deoxyadenosine deaminase n=1 Tax=Salipaludibacillus agaradhaerens TaxID=76935 RepID=A0A9Q4B3I8_SALAG|nr:5'-deoxyadenosine deaminase [Salipaludibacillus agaradhaerens]MCR6097656.1 5'-deoxyadenosine deaminase [Salipaludibacillus agaradhaerens]MCR6112860.1 5'-deoxyadenosine deaminase [Salipaludibacillus agaradhaerens]